MAVHCSVKMMLTTGSGFIEWRMFSREKTIDGVQKLHKLQDWPMMLCVTRWRWCMKSKRILINHLKMIIFLQGRERCFSMDLTFLKRFDYMIEILEKNFRVDWRGDWIQMKFNPYNWIIDGKCYGGILLSLCIHVSLTN